MRKYEFNEEEVRECVANCLVDQGCQSAKNVEGRGLCGRLWFVFADTFQGKVREDDGPVAIGFKVNANVELGGCMM